jgi:secreted trypsin-like serine protease
VLSCNTAQVGGSYVYATKQDRSFLWSGKTATQYKYPQYYGYAVDSAGNYTNKFPAGSFCVNPQGDTNGFYIGTETLSSIISSAIEAALKSHSLI